MKNLILRACFSLFLCPFLFSKASNLRISVDLTPYLMANFGFVRGYVIKGVRSKEIFGLNHLIRNAVVHYNKVKVKNNPKADVIKNSFSIDQQMYPIVDLIVIEKGPISLVKKAVFESMDEFRKSNNSFSLSIKPEAHLFNIKPNGFNAVQFISVNQGKKWFNSLVGLIVKKLKKYGVQFRLPSQLFVNLATVKAPDIRVINLVKKDEKIAYHLKSTRAPKGSDNMRIDKIQIFDGTKDVGFYSLGVSEKK